MDHSRHLRRTFLLSFALLAVACTAPTQRTAHEPARAPQSKPVTLLVFGDGGYHYDHLEKKVYEKVVTEEQFMAKERKDWVEERRPQGEHRRVVSDRCRCGCDGLNLGCGTALHTLY